MNDAKPHRGASRVGYLTELDKVEAGAVLYLRHWCDGPDSQSKVWSDFANALGPAEGRKALKSFETLCDLCMTHSRRPLMRHHVSCQCLGADEACFANFIGYATDGDREDAFLIAAALVTPNIAPMLVSLAQDVGFALKRMATPCAPAPTSTTLH